MEEISQLHDLNLEWGCITNLMNKISDIEGKIEGGWSELIEMVADAMSKEGENKDPASAFFNLYQYMFRLYYRLKSNPTKRDFNVITKTTINSKEVFRVTNYSYEHFLWAKAHGFTGAMSNDFIDIPVEELIDKERRVFERRCK